MHVLSEKSISKTFEVYQKRSVQINGNKIFFFFQIHNGVKRNLGTHIPVTISKIHIMKTGKFLLIRMFLKT